MSLGKSEGERRKVLSIDFALTHLLSPLIGCYEEYLSFAPHLASSRESCAWFHSVSSWGNRNLNPATDRFIIDLLNNSYCL